MAISLRTKSSSLEAKRVIPFPAHLPQEHRLPKCISSHCRFGGSWESSFPVIAKTAVAFQRLFRAPAGWAAAFHRLPRSLPKRQSRSKSIPGHRRDGRGFRSVFPVLGLPRRISAFSAVVLGFTAEVAEVRRDGKRTDGGLPRPFGAHRQFGRPPGTEFFARAKIAGVFHAFT